jgi:hypothetical protein
MRKGKNELALLLVRPWPNNSKKQKQLLQAVVLGSGTASYSIGQVFTRRIRVQMGRCPRVYSKPTRYLLRVEEQQISLNMLVYPNPTTDYLTLAVKNIELSSLSYQLYDSRGQLIENKQITATERSYPNG